MSAEVNIPRLDLNDYINGTPEQKKKFSDDIGKAYNETGFVTIANHGMTKELMDELYAEVKKFFSLSEEDKRKYEKPELAGQRGYTSKGKEKARGDEVFKNTRHCLHNAGLSILIRKDLHSAFCPDSSKSRAGRILFKVNCRPSSPLTFRMLLRMSSI